MLPQIHRCPPGTLNYIIKPGDNFHSLALRFNTTIRAIILANPNINPYGLRIGEQICIPRGSVIPVCTGISYRVKPGDTLILIAQRNNVPIRDLIRVNPGINPYQLYIGQVICIPTPPMPVRKNIPVIVNGRTEYREATLRRSAQGYVIYVLNNYSFTGEAPDRDLLFSALDNRVSVRIERLPANSDINILRRRALEELRPTGTPVEMKGDQISDPFFRQSALFLSVSNASVSKYIILIRIDGALFRFTINIPSDTVVRNALPEIFAMLKTIIVH